MITIEYKKLKPHQSSSVFCGTGWHPRQRHFIYSLIINFHSNVFHLARSTKAGYNFQEIEEQTFWPAAKTHQYNIWLLLMYSRRPFLLFLSIHRKTDAINSPLYYLPAMVLGKYISCILIGFTDRTQRLKIVFRLRGAEKRSFVGENNGRRHKQTKRTVWGTERRELAVRRRKADRRHEAALHAPSTLQKEAVEQSCASLHCRRGWKGEGCV